MNSATRTRGHSRAAQHAVAESLAAIVDSSGDAIIGRDLRGKILSWNPGAERVYGYSAKEMVGTPILRLIPEDRRGEERTNLARIRKGLRVAPYETQRLSKGGRILDVSVSLSPIRNLAGRVVGASVIARDVTSARKKEREAKRDARMERDFSEVIINCLPGVFYLYDEKGRFLRWNHNFARVTGYGPEEIRSMHPLDFFRGADRELVAAQIGVVFERGESRVEAGFAAKDGTVTPYFFTGVVVQFEGLKCLAGVGIDISARHEAETARRESDERFNAFMEASPAVAWMTDADGRHLYMNQAWERAFGLERSKWIGRTAFDMVDDAKAREIRRTDLAVLEQGRPIEIPGDRTMVRGRPRYWDCFKFPFRNPEGRQYIGGIALDITDRKAAQEAQDASEARYRSLFEQAPDGILIADGQGRYLDANASMCWMLGIPRDELIGMSALDIVDPSELPNIEAAISRISSGSPYHREWRFRRRDGSVFPAEVIATKRPDGNLMAMVRDVTERKKSEKALRELNESLERKVAERTEELRNALVRAEAADRVKSSFLATMSHELRTPLNSIIGFTGVVLQGLAGPLNPEQEKQLGMVRGSARHLLELISDVLDISKIEAGQLEVHAEAFDLPQAVRRSVATVEVLAQRKGLALLCHMAPGLGTMRNDRRRVEQVLLNLLNNAIKFTDRGSVTLTVELDDGFRRSPEDPPAPAARFVVSDTGIGIKAADLGSLFQPFRQVDVGLARSSEGTGLGLAICRRLTAMMGGTIGVESKWGKGSSFTFTIPLQPPDCP